MSRHRSRALAGSLARAAAAALLLAGLSVGALLDGRLVLAGVVTVVSVTLLAVAVISICWQTYAWRTPVLIPARHEEAVLGTTIAGVAAIDHPNFEILGAHYLLAAAVASQLASLWNFAGLRYSLAARLVYGSAATPASVHALAGSEAR